MITCNTRQDVLSVLRAAIAKYTHGTWITGVPGSGKTTVHQIATAANYGAVDIDDYGYWADGKWLTNWKEVPEKWDFLMGCSDNMTDFSDYFYTHKIGMIILRRSCESWQATMNDRVVGGQEPSTVIPHFKAMAQGTLAECESYFSLFEENIRREMPWTIKVSSVITLDLPAVHSKPGRA